MKLTIVTFLILTIPYFGCKAKEQALRYNFQVGDQFDANLKNKKKVLPFIVDSKLHRKFKELTMRFKVVSKNDSTATLRATLIRFITEKNNYIYDSQLGFPPFYADDVAYSKLMDNPISFEVNNFGEITKVYNVTSNVNSTSFLEYKYNKFLNRGSYLIFERTLIEARSILQKFIPTTYSVEEFNQKYDNHLYPYHLLQGIIQKNKSDSTVCYYPLKCTNDGVRSVPPHRYTRVFEIDDQVAPYTLNFDYKKGRIKEGKIAYCDEYYGDFEITYFPCLIPIDRSTKVHVVGKIKNHQGASLKLYLWKKYTDSELTNLGELLISENGTFNQVFNLHRPYELILKLTDSLGKSQSKYLFVEPKDSIYIKIDTGTSVNDWIVNCKQNNKFEISKKILAQTLTLDQLSYMTSSEKLIDRIKENTGKLIGLSKKEDLSIGVSRNLIAHIYFKNLSAGIEYINKKVSDKDKKEWKNKLYDTIEIDEYACYASIEMRKFIYSYFNYKVTKQFKVRYRYLVDLEDQFSYARIATRNESRYFLMSYLISEGIRKGAIEQSILLAEKFIACYPDTELADFFSTQLGDISKMRAQARIPQFEVTTLNGEKFHSSSLKNKWSYITFLNTNDDIDWLQIKSLGLINNSLKDNRFQSFLILTNPSITSPTIDSIRNYYKGTILQNLDWKNISTLPYKASYRYSGFLVNPNMQFDELWYSLPTKPHGEYNKQKYYTEEIESLKEYMDLWEEQNNYSSFDMGIFYWLSGICLLLVLCVIVFFNLRQKRMKKIAEEKKERLQLELKFIRSQLNPHFIFNSMNSIQHLVADGKTTDASKYLSEFSALMRQAMVNADKQLVPLKEEISAISKYLELETLRFGFEYDIKIDDEIDIFNVEVPSLFSQPFVENAVIHGIGGLNRQGKICVSFTTENNFLICVIDDNGKGCRASFKNGNGIALCKKRFHMLQQSLNMDIQLKIEDKSMLNPSEKGTLVKITYELDYEQEFQNNSRYYR